MKSYLSYIYGLLAVAFVAGCMKIDIQPIDDSAMASLTLTSTDKVVTRADGVPEEDLNENDINSVQCFFYNTEDEILFTAYKNGLTVTDGFVDDLQFEISSADLSKLNETCSVYAIVNMDKQNIPTDKKISTLKKIAISLGGTHAMQNSFVMVGSANNLQNKDNKLTGEIKVKRVAAKVNVILNVASQIQMKDGETTQTWVPHFSAVGTETNAAMSLTFIGDKSSTLAEIEKVKTFDVDNVSFVETDFEGTETATGDKYIVKMAVPFYTYPKDLSNNETITLQLTWKQVNDDGSVARWATYEYQIPLTNTDKALLSNHEYQLTVNVGVLGNLGDIELTPSYVVTDWGTGEINAELSRPKYLVVDKGNHVIDGVTYHYVMNNVTEVTIPFHSSDDCDIKSITCKQTNLSTGVVKSVDRNDDSNVVTNKSFKAILDNDAKTVTITHGVNNDLYDSNGNDDNGVFDFTPYIYELEITHDGNELFNDKVTIIQYPAIYGYGDENSDFNNGGGTNDDKGFVWVNGYQGSPSSSVSNFDRANGSTSQTLTAVSMYVFTVSSLLGTDYVIGDPRTQNPDNLDEYNFTWGSGKVLNSNDIRSTPLYYLPTDADLNDGENSRTYNMIAPKFRVCSVYGAINTNGARQYYKNVKGRCASYQEDGYPAGRWRLPTAAEFELINTLSMKGLLPRLYETTMDYWCAHGYGRYNTDQNKVNIQSGDDDYGSPSVSVRCVYDDWYWGSEPALKTDTEKRQFTWGDEPR